MTTAANQVKLGGAGSFVQVGDIGASGGTLGRNTTIIPAISSLQTTQAAQGVLINTLFDLADDNRREIHKANEGVAMALAMESPSLPAGANFAIAGGVGYFNNRSAGTASFTARIGSMTSFSAGVGMGFNSGEVGARAGFQHAW